jgi:hypothetical protein
VFIAFLSSIYSGVGSLFYYTSYFPPFLAFFLSSFLAGGALPPFLFLSSTISYSLLNSLRAYDKILSSFGKLFSLIAYKAAKDSLFRS